MDGLQRDWQPPKQVSTVNWAAESRSDVPQSGSGFPQKQESDDKFASTQAQKVLIAAGVSCSSLHKIKGTLVVEKPCDFHLLRIAKSSQGIRKQ